MHFLAHLHLAAGNPYQQIGQIAGDFAKGLVLDELHPEIATGVRKHRRCDSYTDSHSNVRASKALLAGPYRRYAGLVFDLYYDHLLAMHWQQLGGEDLRADVDQMYRSLLTHEAHWPERMQRFTHYLIDTDLLYRLADVSVMEVGLTRIASRLKRKVDLTPAIEQVLEHQEAHCELFLGFYPDLQRAVQGEGGT